MGNVAQLINNLHSLFLADGDKFAATPNFYVFEMYKPHQGARAVRTVIQPRRIACVTGERRGEVPSVAGSACVRDKALTLTVVNLGLAAAAVKVRLRGGSVRSPRRTVLSHARRDAHNTFEDPSELVPRSEDGDAVRSDFVVELPPKSITRLDLSLG